MVWVASIVGALIGSIVTLIFHRMFFTSGTLRIDHSNPEKDLYRFEINDLDSIDKKRRIVLKIDHNAQLSQE